MAVIRHNEIYFKSESIPGMFGHTFFGNSVPIVFQFMVGGFFEWPVKGSGSDNPPIDPLSLKKTIINGNGTLNGPLWQ